MWGTSVEGRGSEWVGVGWGIGAWVGWGGVGVG